MGRTESRFKGINSLNILNILNSLKKLNWLKKLKKLNWLKKFKSDVLWETSLSQSFGYFPFPAASSPACRSCNVVQRLFILRRLD